MGFCSAATPGGGVAVGCVGEDEVDHVAGHVDAGGPFDPLQARGAVDLEDHGTVLRRDQIDTGDVQTQHLGGVKGRGDIVGGEVDTLRPAAAVEVAAELPFARLARHGGHHTAVDDDGAVVRAL